MELSPEILRQVERQLPEMSLDEQRRLLDKLKTYEAASDKEQVAQSFLAYVNKIWPNFIYGSHHELIANKFDQIVEGKLKRLIINMAPRMTKSEFTSWLLPSYYLGKHPERKIIQASNTADLAAGFGRRVRNTVKDDKEFRTLFPGITLATDSTAAAHWHTNKGGEYFAIGVTGKVTGKGADLFIIDDPHALPLDTEIPTPGGFKTIEELQPGDEVFGPDGKPTRVTHKSPIYRDRPLYRLTTNDDQTLYCDAKHLWSVRSDTKLKAPYRNLQTVEIAAWDRANRPCIPEYEAVAYPERDLLVAPYVLGYWLGNGTRGLGRITCHHDDIAWVRDQFEKDGYITTDLADDRSFGVPGLRAQLRDLDVLTDKFVPEAYLTASIEQRKELLQGLMDSDGTVSRDGQCSFQNTNIRLAQACREILNSLGVKASIRVYEDTRDRHVTRQTDYRVNFRMKDAVRMPRKAERSYTPDKRRGRSIGVESTNRRGDVQCITVEREDGLFLAGRGYVVTHNSEQEAKQADFKPEVFDDVYNWYTSGPRQRLQPGAAIVIVMCVAEGERVLMADGTWRPVEAVRQGDRVTAHADGKAVSRKVTAARCSGVDDLVEVTARSCTLRVNRRHPFLVVEGGLKKSARTQEDVEIARQWGLVWRPAGELKKGDTVVTLKSMAAGRGCRPMRYDSKKQMTQDDYWLWGFMFGDGWLATSKKRGDVGVCIALSDKPMLNAKVEELFKRCFKVALKPRPDGYYRTDTKKLAQWLRLRGFTSGAKVKRLPPWVFTLRSSDKRAFLRGFMYADGWLRPSPTAETWHCCLANRQLLDDLRLLARTCGVKTTKIYDFKHQTQAPSSPQPTDAEQFSARFSFRENKMELRARYSHQPEQGRYFRFEDVESVKPAGRSKVYDLTVEGAENFVAEGFVVHNTRWSRRDLTGRLINEMKKGGERFEIIELPAILDENPEHPEKERSLWPQFWPVEELQATREALVESNKWNAQYQQNPTSEAGAILKRSYWRLWPGEKPPPCKYILQSWDTAFTKTDKSNYSACTTWGVFEHREPGNPVPVDNIILLHAYRDKWEFPELKAEVKKHEEQWAPDEVLVEYKSSGTPLVQEMRATGSAVTDFTPTRETGDKIVRANAVSPTFKSGYVWHPDRRWATDVIEECAAFPRGDSDDYVDTVTQALNRFRSGGFIRLPDDDDFDDDKNSGYQQPVGGFY